MTKFTYLYLFVAAILAALTTTADAVSPLQQALLDATQTAATVNPETANASAFGVLNSQDGNAMVGIDGYYSVLLGLQFAAQGSTAGRLDEATSTAERPSIDVQTRNLNKVTGYSNAIVALTPSRFNTEWADAYTSFGASLAEGRDLLKSVVSINKTIEGETGVSDAVEAPDDPNGVVLLSVAVQKTAWQKKMEESTVSWMGGSEVDGFVGDIPVALAKAPNGATVYHLRMADGVVMSIVFVDELDENDAGEWIAESLANAGDFEKKVVQLPNLEIERTFDFKGFKPLAFAFANSADFVFGDKPLKVGKAYQKARLVLDKKGLDAVAVTVFEMVTKALHVPPEAELSFNRPFIAVWSYTATNADGDLWIAPTFAAKVMDPATN